MEIRNNNIKWDKVREGFNQAATEQDVKKLWSMVDKYCYGKEDVDKLDDIADEAYERIKRGTI